MKKFILTTAVFTSALASQAQITVTQAHMPEIGDKILQFTDTMNILSPGNAGANVTWDFSQAQIHEQLEFRVVDVQSTGMSALFPTANIAMTTDDVSFSFFTSSIDKYEVNGIANGGLGMDPIVYDPSLVALQFPMNYDDNFSSSYASTFSFSAEDEGFYKIIIRHHADVEKTVDGWGTITTPFGTYQALRINEAEHATDSTFFMLTETSEPMFLGVDESFTTSFSWYTNDVKLPVATFDQNGDFSYSKPNNGNTGIEDQQTSSKVISYPNPVDAGYGFTFLGLANMDYELFMYDTNGKLIKQEKVSGLNVNISTEGLQPGMYYYNVVATSKNYNGSLIIK